VLKADERLLQVKDQESRLTWDSGHNISMIQIIALNVWCQHITR